MYLQQKLKHEHYFKNNEVNMKNSSSKFIIVLLTFILMRSLLACSSQTTSGSDSNSDNTEQSSSKTITIAGQDQSPALTEIAADLNKLYFSQDSGNTALTTDAVGKLESLGIKNEKFLQELSDELESSTKKGFDGSTQASADKVLVPTCNNNR